MSGRLTLVIVATLSWVGTASAAEALERVEAPAFVIAPVRTALQHFVTPRRVDFIVLINADHLTKDGKLDEELWARLGDELRPIAAAFFRLSGRRPEIRIDLPLKNDHCKPFELAAEIESAASPVVIQAGGACEKLWYNQRTDLIRTATPEQLAELRGERVVAEEPRKVGDIEVYPCKSLLSRMLTFDSDYVVRLTPTSTEIDPEVLRRIRQLLKESADNRPVRVSIFLAEGASVESDAIKRFRAALQSPKVDTHQIDVMILGEEYGSE